MKIKFGKSIWCKFLTALLSVYCSASIFAFAFRPTPGAQLHLMLACLLIFVAFIRLIEIGVSLRWRRNPSKLILPAIVLLAGYLGGVAGHQYRDFEFKQDLPKYQQAVGWVKGQPLEVNRENLTLPAEFQGLAYVVQAELGEECGFMVDFFWGAGFPVKHTVRRYIETSEYLAKPECHKGWRQGRKLADHWYELVD